MFVMKGFLIFEIFIILLGIYWMRKKKSIEGNKIIGKCGEKIK